MDFDLSAEQYELRDEARRFLEKQSPPAHVREFVDDEAGWSRDLWKRMADLGWMALPFPEQHGGLGRGFLDLVLLLEELGRALAPVPFLSSVALAGHAILRQGSEEQRAEWLPKIATGERIGALALADANGSWDDTLLTRADQRGGGWRLTGEKRYVLDAPAADVFVVAALAPEGARWFLVEEPAGVQAHLGFDRTRAIGSVALEETPGEPLAMPGLEPSTRFAVAALCAEMVGAAQKVLDMSVAYANDREQFGRPIGSFQAIKHKCAEMAAMIEAARSGALYACWAVAEEAKDAELAVSVAKSFASDALAHVGDEGVQIHGGIAFTWEHDMHLYLRRLKTAQVLFGDAAYHRERIARLVGL